MARAGVRVVRNDFPKVIEALPKAIDKEVDDSGNDLADQLKSTIWRDTGLLRRVTTNHEEGTNHCEIAVGYYRGQGFYSGFQEFGTVKQAARPIVVPTSHQFEPVYAQHMSDAVRKACEV